jgi:hypothetical protein
MHSTDSTTANCSPAPWSYEYNPYMMSTVARAARKSADTEIPAFEICDADGNKIFDTNEDSPQALQEAIWPRGCTGIASVTHRMCQPPCGLRPIRWGGRRDLSTCHCHH